jgi:hypothetical protein
VCGDGVGIRQLLLQLPHRVAQPYCNDLTAAVLPHSLLPDGFGCRLGGCRAFALGMRGIPVNRRALKLLAEVSIGTQRCAQLGLQVLPLLLQYHSLGLAAAKCMGVAVWEQVSSPHGVMHSTEAVITVNDASGAGSVGYLNNFSLMSPAPALLLPPPSHCAAMLQPAPDYRQ